MATRASLLTLLPCLLLTNFASASVEDLCRSAARRDKLIKYDFCVRSLHSAPGSGSADNLNFAVIAGHLGSQKAKATLPKINELLKGSTGVQKAVLQDCQEVYSEAVDDLKSAAQAAKEHRFVDANRIFSTGLNAASTCEDGFSESKLTSPLAPDDNELTQLAAIGEFMTATGHRTSF